jgi:hypothetical protein
MATNWTLIKNEYETLGTSVKELSTSHHVSEVMLKTAIEEGGWKKFDIEDTGTEDMSARLSAMELKHQASLVPRFIALQEKMLTKCNALLDGVSDLEDAGSLKIVSEVIEKHRPNILGQKGKEVEDKGMTIKIMNKVGDGPDVAINAVEITATAAGTNGLGGVPRGTPSNDTTH